MKQTEDIYKIFLNSEGISTDSRGEVKGKLFFALSGENFDGNVYAEQALRKGALKAVVDNPDIVLNNDYILVDNTLETLQKLAVLHRRKFDVPVIGITDTNGKTTTKELVSNVLGSDFKVVATKGNLNNHIGVPLTLLSINENTEVAVVEMGANHIGEIKYLCNIAMPTHGIITNIGKAHLEGFGSFEGVVKTKKELYDYLEENEGIAFVNGDDNLLKELSRNIKRIFYCEKNCDVNGEIISRFPFLKIRVNIEDYGFELTSKLFGSYNFSNIMAAVVVGNYFMVPTEKIKKSLENYIPSNNRSQMTETTKNKIILDAYNANPVSLSKAIIDFNDAKFKDSCLIIGDMFELGEYSHDEHQKMVDLIEEKGFDCVFLVGVELYNTDNNFIKFKSTQDALKYFENNPLKGKTILLKGSRGMHLEKLLSVL
jgi:UDP-N-acetylmuramoyl-tripeptide--D-alanyl-D-alanine ligase